MITRTTIYGLLVAAALAAGCASTSAAPAHRDMTDETMARGAPATAWRRGGPEDQQVDRAVREILSRELTLEGAVQIALWNDRNLQVVFEELGIAQADLVQAGLLPNPTLSAGYGFPLSGGQPGVQVELVGSFASLVTLSSRKAIARAQLEAARRRVGHVVLATVFETRVAFVRATASLQVLGMRRAILDAAGASLAVQKKAHEAGNVSDLVLANEQALVATLQLETRRAELEAAEAREQLTRRMGLYAHDTAWRIARNLPEMPVSEVTPFDAEARAVRSRLDLAAAHADVEAVSQGLHFTRQGRFLPGLSAGVAFERGPEGYRLLGPTVSVELPLFDRGQAAVARLTSQLRQAEAREHALAVEIRSHVREGSARLEVSRAVVEAYRDQLVPLRERIVKLSQEQYDAMLLGVFQLVQAKQAEFAAYADFIAALRDYWVARFSLEQVVGAPLAPSPPSSQPTPPAPQPEPHHHHP